MQFWMNLKVKTKAMIMVAVAVATLVAVVSTGLAKMRGMAANEEGMSTAVKHVALLNDLKYNLTMIRLDLVYLMTLEDPARVTEKTDDIRNRRQTIQEGTTAFMKEDLDAKEKELIEAFRQGVDAYLAQGSKMEEMSLKGVGDPEARRQIVAFATGTVAPLSVAPAKVIGELVANNVAGAAGTYQKDLSGYRTSTYLLIGLTLGAALFLVLIGTLIANSISGPLKQVFDTLTNVAGGDLTARSGIGTSDEMGMLAGEVNLMAEKLMSTMNRVADNSVQVASAANELQNTAEQMATGAEEVAAQAATVATASEEMAATSSDIARNCHHAADGSEIANRTALTGAEVVEQTVRVMERIATRVKESSATVAGLGARSDQIGEIVGTIQDIADQTNLLALNAAIEAARAGEQGRGFAVVADEVRALAERTTLATRQIAEMIAAIQTETRQAVGAMEAGVHEVEQGTLDAAKSGESLQEILTQIGGVTLQVNQIATAAEEQTATTSEITHNLHQITEVVHQTSQGAQSSANMAGQLARLSDDLHALVGQFRLA